MILNPIFCLHSPIPDSRVVDKLCIAKSGRYGLIFKAFSMVL